MAIYKSHACHATIVSAVALYQRAMLIVSLDPSAKKYYASLEVQMVFVRLGVSACVCKMDSSCIIGSIQQRKSCQSSVMKLLQCTKLIGKINHEVHQDYSFYLLHT